MLVVAVVCTKYAPPFQKASSTIPSVPTAPLPGSSHSGRFTPLS